MDNNNVLQELLSQRREAQSTLFVLSTNDTHRQDAIVETIKSLDKVIISICNHSEYDKEYDEEIYD